MNPNLEQIYKIVKPRIDGYILKNVLGGNISSGIERFYLLESELSENGKIDYAKILVESLSEEILDSEEFLKVFIMQCFNKEYIEDIAKTLKLEKNLSEFKKRKHLLSLSKSKRKTAILNSLNLDENFFRKPTKSSVVSKERITPFTPVPIKEENAKDLIPEEFLSLHNYQKLIKDSLSYKIIQQPQARALVHMPTGSGKTKTSIESIIDFIRVNLRLPFNGGTVVWFAHSKELCQQAYNTFKATWQFKGDSPINAYKLFGDSDYDKIEDVLEDKISIVFIGFQKFNSLYKSKPSDIKNHRLKQFLYENTKLAIVDEAHKALATTYKDAVEFVTQMPDCRLIGLTATPGRSNYVQGDNDNQSLADFFGSNIIRITDQKGNRIDNPLQYLQKKEVLAEIEQIELESTIDFTKFGYSSNDLSRIESKDDIGNKELDIISTDPHRNSMIIKKVKESYHQGESILIFACSTDHCIILQRLLEATENIDSGIILGSTNKTLREKSINNFKAGNLKVIINYGVLSTGFDAPKLNTLIVARPTKSIVLYSQIVGRALRGPKNGGNKKNKLITIKDNLIGFPNPDFMFSYWEKFWK